VDDHLGVLGAVDAALAERDVGLGVSEERVVAAELVDPHAHLAPVDGRQRGSESEALDVELRPGHPVVRHDLLELVLVAREDEARAGVGGGRPGLALDRHVRAAQRGGGGQVGERDAVVGAAQDRVGAEVVGVLLVGQALDAEVGDRVRREHLRRRRRGARRRSHGQRAGRDDRGHDATKAEAMHALFSS